MQRPPLRHEIGKLSRSVVDQIPLVLYIPPPPEEDNKDSTDDKTPTAPYTYPPLPTSKPAKKRRFAFLRRSKKLNAGNTSRKSSAAPKDGEPKTWEDNWVPGDYPFVRLEGNRAACAVCLMDFEEPKRMNSEATVAAKQEATPSPTQTDAEADASASTDVQEIRVSEVTREDEAQLHLEDAGEGSQPLRLLPCGHVFHVSIALSSSFTGFAH